MQHDEDNYDSMHYDMDITFNVRIAKWRIDDPTDTKNAEWSLWVYDRNLERWVNIVDLNRPGEYGRIESIHIYTDDERPLKAPKVAR